MDRHSEELLNLLNTPAFVIAITTVVLVMKTYEEKNIGIPRHPTNVRDIWRNAYMHRLLYGGRDSSLDKLRMNTPTFLNLAQLMREKRLLRDTKHVCVEEQLSMFLNTVGHKTTNRVKIVDFVRSGETISRYFNEVLQAICHLKDLFIRQPGPEVHPIIESNPNWYPFFKDCIGLIDGTHIDANVPTNLQARFRGRKGLTQNVLAMVTPEKLFTYVLATEYIKCHSRHAPYINKPIRHYDDLQLIIGNDVATGEFRKSLYSNWGTSSSGLNTIRIDEDNLNQGDAEFLSTHEEVGQPVLTKKSINLSGTSTNNKKSSTCIKSSSKQRKEKDNDMLSSLVKQVGAFTTIQNTVVSLQLKKELSAAVFALEGFDFKLLDDAFIYLGKDPEQSTNFIARPPIARQMWMTRFKNEQDQIPTIDDRDENVNVL